MDDDGLPDPDCLDLLLAHRGDLDFWGPVVVDEADPERLVFPIRLPGGTRVVHDVGAVDRAAVAGLVRDVVIPFNGVLVTRALAEQIGYPREEFFIWGDDHEYRLRAERAGARIATVAAARVRHPSVGDLGTPMMFGRTTYNHSPSDLKHYCMARNNTLNLRDYRGWPHVLMFWAKTVWFYTLTRPDARSAAAQRPGDPGRAARRLHRPPAVPRVTRTETVAVVVVTYNRADLLGRMLDGLAAQTHRPDAVYVVDNASTDHTREVLERWHGGDLPLEVTHSPDNLGGAGGFHLGLRRAYADGFDRIWLMDDDVVPAPDCLAVLMARDEECLMSVREDTAGRLVEKAAVRFDLTNPLAIKPKTAMVETTYGTRAAMPERVELENVAFEGFMVHRSVIAEIGLPRPDVLHLLRRRRLRDPLPPGGPAHLGDPRRRAGAAAGLRPAARPGLVEGLLHVPQPLRGAPAVRRERAGPAQAVADRRDRGPAQPAARRAGRGWQCDPRPTRRTRNAAAPAVIRRLTHCATTLEGELVVQS